MKNILKTKLKNFCSVIIKFFTRGKSKTSKEILLPNISSRTLKRIIELINYKRPNIKNDVLLSRIAVNSNHDDYETTLKRLKNLHDPKVNELIKLVSPSIERENDDSIDVAIEKDIIYYNKNDI
jgi:hypothetical protein